MMKTEVQNKLWKDLPENKREQFRNMFEDENANKDYLKALQDCFGSHNLKPKPRVQVWADFEENEEYEEIDTAFVEFEDFLDEWTCGLATQKLCATYQIGELITHGYGGQVTSEEWKNEHLDKYVIVPVMGDRWQQNVTFVVRAVRHMDANHFIAFHTDAQAKRFITFPSNISLVRDYYLL